MTKQELTDHELKKLISETDQEIQRLENYREHMQGLLQRARDRIESAGPRKLVKKKAVKKAAKKK